MSTNAVLQAIATWLIPIIFGALSAFVTLILTLPTKFGERMLGEAFEKRIAAFKHQQTIELGKLQGNLDHLKDRGQRSNEREFQALQDVWERFVEAYRNMQGAVAQFYSFPDLDRMTDDDVASFLDANNVAPDSRMRILKADDKKHAFGNYIEAKTLNAAVEAIQKASETVLKQSVFIPADLQLRFELAIQRLRKAQAEIVFKHEVRGDRSASADLVGEPGETMFNELRDATRKRLLREI